VAGQVSFRYVRFVKSDVSFAGAEFTEGEVSFEGSATARSQTAGRKPDRGRGSGRIRRLIVRNCAYLSDIGNAVDLAG
jgi:hypothetical protein